MSLKPVDKTVIQEATKPFEVHSFGTIPDSQRLIIIKSLKKLASAFQITSQYAYVEKDGKRFFTHSVKQGVVSLNVEIAIDTPTSGADK